MNASELMAMIDDRLSDGGNYPTLDDYAEALADLVKASQIARRPETRKPLGYEPGMILSFNEEPTRRRDIEECQRRRQEIRDAIAKE